MGKKYKNLFAQITSEENFWLAYKKTAKDIQLSSQHLEFRANLAANVETLRQAVINETYQPGEPNIFPVFEPMRRTITAMPFADRMVHHALCNIIEPIFERVFLPGSYACRVNKGTHAAAKKVQSILRHIKATGGDPWVLKTDFKKYFHSIPTWVLLKEICRKISCQPTIRLIKRIIGTGVGLAIGWLISQLGANIVGHVVDRWLTHTAKCKYWVRYMDDVVIIARSREALEPICMAMRWVSEVHLKLEFSQWNIQPESRGVNFVGYRIWATHMLLRKQSVINAKRKLKQFAKNGDTAGRDRFLGAWLGHAGHANSFNLLKSLGVDHDQRLLQPAH